MKNFNIDMVVEAPALAELQLVSVFALIPPNLIRSLGRERSFQKWFLSCQHYLV